MRNNCSAKRSQKGAVLAIFAIGLVAIIALAGLALDVSHAYVDKTRLQNAFDAAALSGAMGLITSGGSTIDATDDARDTFTRAVQGTELDSLTPDVEFSPTLKPFDPSGSPPRFVRVKLRNDGADKRFSMTTWLARVIGKETIKIGGSAVAGPVAADSCNLAPFVVCGNMEDPAGCFKDGSDRCYGFDTWNNTGEEEECYLKGCAQGGNDCNNPDLVAGDQCGAQSGSGLGGGNASDLGTGSFYLARLEGQGGKDLAAAFKDGFHKCYDPNDPIFPETGNMVGPMRYYNTKFDIYDKNIKNASRTDYPPDEITITDSPGGGRLYFNEYNTSSTLETTTGGVPHKRVFGVIIADCRDKLNGSSNAIKVASIGCFFGTQPAPDGGNAQVVWGQFLGKEAPGCLGEKISTSPTTVTQKIILYKDVDSNDS